MRLLSPSRVLLAACLLFLISAPFTFAHEAYVLSKEEFSEGVGSTGINVFSALRDPHNLKVFGLISIGILLALLSATILQIRFGKKISAWFSRGYRYGQPILRLALGAALLFGAAKNSFLGPEINLSSLGFEPYLRLGLIMAGILIIVGFMSEIGAIIALIIFACATWHYGWYLTSYASYLAEILALIIFGPGAFSLDQRFNISRLRFERFKNNETLLVRLGYGIALIFSAITIKFLHPTLTLSVINNYHLTDFHLLFPSDPTLALLGAALAELTIGLFIAIGFQTRLVVLVSLFYITLSLLFFREAVWPHLILYGLAFYLLLTPQKLALDNWIERIKK